MTKNLENISKLFGEPVYDRHSAASYLDRSLPFIDSLRRSGRLRPVYLGKVPYYTQSALREAFKGDK